uniref:T-complex protein 1 subunit delta n=1 Tax=Trypanosoma congolense (strain IL3000) TaxID=1068625 RepID=G0UVB3_TRYCI|nr:putative T-complex protein 1, delta subunit [Trypanosoma congolense IL3000]
MSANKKSNENKKDTNTQTDVRLSNITSAKAVSDCVRTSLGPRGMDKMIIEPRGEVVISNDGATILSKLQVTHPCAKMLVELSKAQDVEAGDGTTSVVVLCGALLRAVEELLLKGIHPTQISECFNECAKLAEQVLEGMSVKIDIEDKETLIRAAVTSLNSKIISQNSDLIAPMAVDAVRQIMRDNGDVDLRDVRIVTALGGTIDESVMLSSGMVFKQKASHVAGGPVRIANATIALIQFQLSPPKTDMESTVTISDYNQMDRALKEERKYLLNLCKQIKDAGVNVLLVQKSVLRDAVTIQSLDFLAKMKIMVVKDIERSDIDFITKTLGCLPVANIENLRPEKFGHADLVLEENTPSGKIIRITGVQAPSEKISRQLFGKTVTFFLRGSNSLMLEEAERALHDSLCVIRSIVKKRAIIAGGAAGETEVCLQLSKYARERAQGMQTFCMRAFADAFEVIPYTLAENAGLQPISIVTELRNAHASGSKNAGVNVRKGCVTDMVEESVVQPLLVSTSAVRLAAECVMMILKIDDIIMTRA